MNNINGSKKISIEVKVTDRCNQNCLYCVNSDGVSGSRDIDHMLLTERLREWSSLPASAWEIEEVRVTGGEPLMHTGALDVIVSACASMGIRSGINTNGTLLTTDIADHLKNAGMKIVKISLDTLQPEINRKICGSEAGLEDTLNGIRTAVDAGFETIIRFTLSRINKDELVKCYAYASSMGASRFQVKPLIPAGRGKMCRERLGREELLSVINNFSKQFHQTTTSLEFLCVPPENTSGLPTKACGSVNKIYISNTGQVSACNYLSNGIMGDLSTRSLEDILNFRSLFTNVELFSNSHVLAGCPQYRRY